jgi:hypothetical protein
VLLELVDPVGEHRVIGGARGGEDALHEGA